MASLTGVAIACFGTGLALGGVFAIGGTAGVEPARVADPVLEDGSGFCLTGLQGGRALLHAEALMDLSPWDYWEAGGSRPKGQTTTIVATLERVLRKDPDHPGAIHFYIHMVEASDRPERAEPYPERLGGLMPGAGHLVHMPFHIYFRLGRYADAIEANREAVAADQAYLDLAKPEGMYPQAYYPHNLHSLMVSAQMAGDGRSAVQAA